MASTQQRGATVLNNAQDYIILALAAILLLVGALNIDHLMVIN